MSTFIINNRHRIFFYVGLMVLGLALLLLKKSGEGTLVFIYILSSLLYYLPLSFFLWGTKIQRPSPGGNSSKSLTTLVISIVASLIGLAAAVFFKKTFLVHFFSFVVFVTIEITLWKIEIDSKRKIKRD